MFVYDSPDALRARFVGLDGFCWTRDAWSVQKSQKPAAVLLPLRLSPVGMQVLLTRRTDHLHHHPGQICFPGGQREEIDESPIATAVRESGEELGLSPAEIEVLGVLPDFGTSSGFCITPVVGLVAAEAALRLDPFEVAEAFEVPLRFLVEPANYQLHRFRWANGERELPAVPYPGRFIWGATAGILRMLAAFLGGLPGDE